MSKPIRPLRTDKDRDGALAEYESYFDSKPKPGTEEADRFELLGMVLAKYEEEHCPARSRKNWIDLLFEVQLGKRSCGNMADIILDQIEALQKRAEDAEGERDEAQSDLVQARARIGELVEGIVAIRDYMLITSEKWGGAPKMRYQAILKNISKIARSLLDTKEPS